jgi:hypothetical protein
MSLCSTVRAHEFTYILTSRISMVDVVIFWIGTYYSSRLVAYMQLKVKRHVNGNLDDFNIESVGDAIGVLHDHRDRCT